MGGVKNNLMVCSIHFVKKRKKNEEAAFAG